MAGFGFLKQMSETFKYNRDLLGKTKRKPFDKGQYKAKSGNKLNDEKHLTESDRQELISKVNESNMREKRRRLLILILAILVLIILYFGFIPFLNLMFN